MLTTFFCLLVFFKVERIHSYSQLTCIKSKQFLQCNQSLRRQFQVEGIPDDNDSKNSAHLMQQWEEHMQDFAPDDFISFEIFPGQIEIKILEEAITKPTKIRGAFYSSIFVTSYIDFIVKDPQNQTVTQLSQKKEALFSVNVTKAGIYQFIFNNKKVNFQ